MCRIRAKAKTMNETIWINLCSQYLFIKRNRKLFDLLGKKAKEGKGKDDENSL